MFKRLTTADRIKKGVRFLDRKVRGWRSKVDFNTLDINQPKSCMLGQTDTDFFDHKKALGLTDQQCAHMGFIAYAALGKTGHFSEATYTGARAMVTLKEHIVLTKAWKVYLYEQSL